VTDISSGGSASTAIQPSTTVLTAADAADSMANLWQASGQASARHAVARLRSPGANRAIVWARPESGESGANSACSRRYRQGYNGLAVGADRGSARDGSSAGIVASIGQIPLSANYQQGKDANRSSVWVRTDSGELSANTAYSRRYRQRYSDLAVGADRGFARNGSSAGIDVSIGQVRSSANYQQGKGESTGATLGLYGGWNAAQGPYLVLGADASSLEISYVARDSAGREIVGKNRTQAGRVYAESGYPIQLTDAYYIEPQLGLSVGRIRGNQRRARNGVAIDQGSQTTGVARPGMTFGKTLQGERLRGNLYVRAAALHYFGDDLDITASKDGGSILVDTAKRTGSGSEFALGVDVGFAATGLFIEASEASGVDTKRSWSVQAGLRHSW
jgi:outer membrane autotransporter protein